MEGSDGDSMNNGIKEHLRKWRKSSKNENPFKKLLALNLK